ncbi:hypothetical protein [Sphingobacterium lactis]|uniref:hypothetical protein n=1 Tax=Sphingobacterium lactis TaxID=797291 RepID=UPI003DA54860
MNYLENKKVYETPAVQELHIELEYGIAAGSVEASSMKQSWEDSSSTHDVEW